MSYDPADERKRRFLGRGALTSLLIHAGFLFPLVTLAFILGAREAAMRDEEVAMTFDEVDPATLPEDLPPIDDSPRPEPKKPALAQKEALVQPEPKPQEPPPPPPPPQEAPKPQPQPKLADAQKKSVDVDVDKEEPPDPNARFLAEKSSRAKEETRATRTNLEKAQAGEKEASSPSDRKDQQAGDDEDRIAQTEDERSKAGRSAPAVTPRRDPKLADSPTDDRRNALTMRNLPRRQHEVSPETSMMELPRDPEGFIPMPPDQLQSMKDLPGRDGDAARPNLRLSAKQYAYVFGDDREAAAALQKRKSSKKAGRFTEHLARVQQALENFIPEVKPGNQTVLNTRAAPFAAFIARMHRSIHELWGFGFLADLEGKGPTFPLNNRELFTKLEIVLAGDGTVDKVTVVKPSGQLPFDVAAIDVVYKAGPYAEPPPAIRSGNGKIYVHWTFHRDERQCATSGTEYFILDNAGDKGANNARPIEAPPAPHPHPHGSEAPGQTPPPSRLARQ